METVSEQPKQNPADVPGAILPDHKQPAFDSMALLSQYGHAKVAQVAAMQAPNTADTTTARGKSCPASSDYDQYIDKAARNIYDPKELGNIAALEHKFDCDIHTTDDIFKYANQALAITGDRFDLAITPADVKTFERQERGGYSGIGLEIEPAFVVGLTNSASASVIARPIPGKAADKAGLEAGDAFVKIDGQDVHSLAPRDIADLITSGAAGTKVDIVVDRDGQKVEKIVTRQTIESPPVVHDKDLGDGIAYIKIDTFNNSTEAAQLAAAMDKYKNAKAFVIDVRDNPGGLVEQSLESAELLVKDGTLMTTRQRLDSAPDKPAYGNQTYSLDSKHLIGTSIASDTDTKDTYIYSRLADKAADRPVVVLTNGMSASASEIFTGAVHDTGHDTVIGTTTYGKGIGQSVIKDVPDGGYLKVTSMHYLTPSGHWPGPGTGADKAHPEYGLKPDIPIADPAKGSATDGQLNGAVDFLNKKLTGK